MDLHDTLNALEVFFNSPPGGMIIGGGLLAMLVSGGMAFYGVRSGNRRSAEVVAITGRILDMEHVTTTTRLANETRQTEILDRLAVGMEAAAGAVDVLSRRQEAMHTETLAILQPIRQDGEGVARVVIELRAMLARLQQGQENLLGVAETLSERVEQQGQDAAQLRSTIEALSQEIDAYNKNMADTLEGVRRALEMVTTTAN